MSTVVFFNYPAYGHINPTLPIVTELVRRGEKVFYYALEEFQSAIEYTGAIFRSHGKDFPFHLTNAELSTAMSLHCLLQTSQWVLDNLLQEVRAIQPDYIMYDAFCPWGRYIGEILRVPTVSMISGLLMNSRILCGVPSATLEVVSVFIKKYKYTARSQAIANALSKKYNLQRSNIIDLLLNDGMLNIVYTSKAFQPLSSSFDQKHFKFVGPSILPRPQTHHFPFEKLGEKPLIYISLGTIFNKKAAFYRACFEAFADTDWQVVMTIGRHVCRDSLGPIPSNFIVREFVPQLEILQRTSLFITHGGMNSVSEALYYNVPLVVVPQSADQPWIAKRVVELGVGRSLSPRRVTAKSLRRAAEKIFSQPAYANAAASVGESLRTAGGYKTAADEILNFKRTHGIR
ncbi:MAG: glycosyl transferase [Ktedonobacteraceae bacterium]|nr:glycosyl transferase [Ktedonobacteraceae bacterium]